jgi:hypothetical protein
MGSLRKLDQGFPPLQTAARRDSLAGLGRGLCPWSAMQSRLERNGQGAMGRGPLVASHVPSHTQTAAKMQVFRRQFSRRYRRLMDGVRWRDRHHWRERRHGRRGPRFVEFDRGATSGDEKTGKRGCSRQVERLERPV